MSHRFSCCLLTIPQRTHPSHSFPVIYDCSQFPLATTGRTTAAFTTGLPLKRRHEYVHHLHQSQHDVSFTHTTRYHSLAIHRNHIHHDSTHQNCVKHLAPIATLYHSESTTSYYVHLTTHLLTRLQQPKDTVSCIPRRPQTVP